MNLSLEATPLHGCHVVRLPRSTDARGSFTKFVHGSSFGAHGLVGEFPEVYLSTSRQNVVRGLHFQLPPHDHAKLVTCLSGRVWDAVVDVRRGSPTYGRHFAVELDAEDPRALYIPAGLAHGFLALEEPASMLYFVSSEYAPSHDAGIRWDSAGISWPLAGEPLVSPRDAGLVAFSDFVSPFVYESGEMNR